MEDSAMRTAASTSSHPGRRIFLLTALCAFLTVSTGLAQAPQTLAAAPQAVPASTAEFLATLADPPAGPDNGLLPAPRLLSTICHTNADCGRNELCCYPCGVPDCNFVCMKVKTCPLIP
jgi:hypothetical protein